MISPPPYSIEKGGAGGYAPSPPQLQFPGWGVTPRITPSPHTKPRGTLDPPWKVPGSRFFTAAASQSRTITGRASCDHTLPAEVGYAHAAPTSPAGLAYGGATNGPTCPSLAVAGRTGPGGLGRLCWKGRRVERAAPRQRPSPGVADPQRSQLAQRHGRRFPEAVCGTLLPGDGRSGNQVYDVIAPAYQ